MPEKLFWVPSGYTSLIHVVESQKEEQQYNTTYTTTTTTANATNSNSNSISYINVLKSVSVAYAGGEILSLYIKNKFTALFNIILHDIYGTSECGVILANGRPPSTILVKLDFNTRVLYTKSEVLGYGYYNNYNATRAHFIGEWYNTGDVFSTSCAHSISSIGTAHSVGVAKSTGTGEEGSLPEPPISCLRSTGIEGEHKNLGADVGIDLPSLSGPSEPPTNKEDKPLPKDGGACETCIREGNVIYTYEGRADEQWKTHGRWVSPAKIEDGMRKHSNILDCICVGQSNGEGLIEPVLFNILKDKTLVLDVNDVASFLSGLGFPSYLLPRRVAVVDRYPMTASGNCCVYYMI